MRRKRKAPKRLTQLKIPKPVYQEDGTVYFAPVIKMSRFCPWGYKVSEEDPDILEPIEEELYLLEQAKEHLKIFSLRDVANWLTANTGRKITHQGLKTRLEAEMKNDRMVSFSRRLFMRLVDKYMKARALELTRLGRRVDMKSIKEELIEYLEDVEPYDKAPGKS